MLTEHYIWSLLTGEHDWADIIHRLEWLGRRKAPGLTGHHIEPEREMIVWLKPLEHLAIHIAHARLERTGPYYAKVGAFVKPHPGKRPNIKMLGLSDEAISALYSFGQKRPGSGDPSYMIGHPNTLHMYKNKTAKQREWSKELGRRNRENLKGKPRPDPVTWGHKTAAGLRALTPIECEFCGQKIKGQGNLKQHQGSSKCLKNRPTSSTTPTEQ